MDNRFLQHRIQISATGTRVNSVLSLKCFICEVLLFLLDGKMIKGRREGKSGEMIYYLLSLPLFSLLDFNFLTLLCFTLNRESVLFSPPVNIIVMILWLPILEICHIYNFFEYSIYPNQQYSQKRQYRHYPDEQSD